MDSRVEDRSPQERKPGNSSEDEQRWGTILQKVVSEQSNDPWYVKTGVSLLWSAGIAVAAGIAAALVLGIRSLFSTNVQFTLRNLSDHSFWTAALLMIAGMVSPSSVELDSARNKKKQEERTRSLEDRRARAVERRLRRVYDPWRWRIWGGAALAFGLAILTGFVS